MRYSSRFAYLLSLDRRNFSTTIWKRSFLDVYQPIVSGVRAHCMPIGCWTFLSKRRAIMVSQVTPNILMQYATILSPCNAPSFRNNQDLYMYTTVTDLNRQTADYINSKHLLAYAFSFGQSSFVRISWQAIRNDTAESAIRFTIAALSSAMVVRFLPLGYATTYFQFVSL